MKGLKLLRLLKNQKKMFEFAKKKIVDFNNAKSFFNKLKKKKIIHCHGVFDLVHPGHIRHFDHCKSKADILVVSLTPDRFIKKGNYRPLVPEKIRANNFIAEITHIIQE